MKTLLIAIVIIISISCKQTKQEQKETLPPDFDNEFSLDTSIKFQNVKNVANGYSFSYPISFIEAVDTIGQVDSSVFYSPDKETKIKYIIEGDTKKNENEKDRTEEQLFKQYFDSLTNSKHGITAKAKIIKSTYAYKNYEYGNPANFMLMGERDTTEFIMKTELSEVPINGDLTFKSFIMEYPKSKKSYFRPVALEIAKSFKQ